MGSVQGESKVQWTLIEYLGTWPWTLSLVLAQGTPGDGSWAGWTGAGLLGLVLGWLLLTHLPAKDKQIETLIKDKDKQIGDLIATKDKQVRDLIDDHSKQRKEDLVAFKAEIENEREHCSNHVESARQHWDRLLNELKAERVDHHRSVMDKLDDLGEAIDEMRNRPSRRQAQQEKPPGPGGITT